MCREGARGWTEAQKQGVHAWRGEIPHNSSKATFLLECSRIIIISTFVKEASPNANKDHTRPQVCRAPTQKAPSSSPGDILTLRVSKHNWYSDSRPVLQCGNLRLRWTRTGADRTRRGQAWWLTLTPCHCVHPGHPMKPRTSDSPQQGREPGPHPLAAPAAWSLSLCI